MYWIKSADRWININHITRFSIQTDMEPLQRGLYNVYAHLSIGITKLSPDFRAYGGSPPTPYETAYEIHVFSGTRSECQDYVTEKTLLQQTYHWLTHLAAGLLGGLVIWLTQR